MIILKVKSLLEIYISNYNLLSTGSTTYIISHNYPTQNNTRSHDITTQSAPNARPKE